jgi:hypothetical protein
MTYGTAALIFVVGELASLPIFALLKGLMKLPKTSPARRASIAKGILERAVLYIGLLYGFPHILVAFGALKLGTRLHEDRESKISNNYFLIGNLISMLLAMLYAIIARKLGSG